MFRLNSSSLYDQSTFAINVTIARPREDKPREGGFRGGNDRGGNGGGSFRQRSW